MDASVRRLGGLLCLYSTSSFLCRGTANWRGYTTSWEVRDDRLYLTGLSGDVCKRRPEAGAEPSSWCRVGHFGECDRQQVRLTDLVRVPPGGIFAEWVNEEVRIARGPAVNYVHLGWGSRFEHEERLDVEEGLVVRREAVDDRVRGGESPSIWSLLLRSIRRRS
jgi:hypothetical protein